MAAVTTSAAFAAQYDPLKSDAVVKAVHEFAASLSPAERDEMRKTGREDLSVFHFGIGSRIRERYFSAPNSELVKAFCPVPDATAEYCYVDNASGAMIVKVWELIRQESN